MVFSHAVRVPDGCDGMDESQSSRVRFIDREHRRIEVAHDQVFMSYPMNVVPDNLYQAMLSAMDGELPSSDKIRRLFMSSLMKPTVCSRDRHDPFPFNTAVKVVRMTLTDDVLPEVVSDLEGELLALQGRKFEDTVDDRIEMYRRVYLDESKVDRFRLGAIEMFGNSTYNNIRKDPRVVLSFFWPTADGTSGYCYQLNCIAEIAPPGDPYYRFMRVLRSLFSYRFLDIKGRGEYPCAYKFWVCEAYDKSLNASGAGFVRA